MASHSYTTIWIHLIWTTKKRERVLMSDIAYKIHEHIIEYANKNDIPLETLNVQPEHVHCLLNLPPGKTIENVVKLLKGESSHWINENKLLNGYFSWQRGYGAFSVSASHVERVKEYIKEQEEHHKRRTFREEYQILIRKYELSKEKTVKTVN